MHLKDLCMGCMREKGIAEICPYCNWVETEEADIPLHLPPRTALKDRYVVGKTLESSKISVTYVCYDRIKDQKVAIKEFLPLDLVNRFPRDHAVIINDIESQQEFNFGLGKFIEESMALQKLRPQTGLPRVLDLFRTNGTAYRIREFIEGSNLTTFLRKNGDHLNFRVILKIFNPIFQALAETHRNGLIHHDIYPENIIVSREGIGKLINFSATDFAFAHQWKMVQLIMRPGYSPYELYRNALYQLEAPNSPSVDIYSLAAAIYRCLTGLLPPDAITRAERDTLLAPSRLDREIPGRAEAALLKALAVNPALRYAQINDFKEDLWEIGPVESAGGSATPASAFTTVRCPACGVTNEVLTNDLASSIAHCFACEKPLAAAAPASPGEVLEESADKAAETTREKVTFQPPAFVTVHCPKCGSANDLLMQDVRTGADCQTCGTFLSPETARTPRTPDADQPVAPFKRDVDATIYRAPDTPEKPAETKGPAPPEAAIAPEAEELLQEPDSPREAVEPMPPEAPKPPETEETLQQPQEPMAPPEVEKPSQPPQQPAATVEAEKPSPPKAPKPTETEEPPQPRTEPVAPPETEKPPLPPQQPAAPVEAEKPSPPKAPKPTAPSQKIPPGGIPRNKPRHRDPQPPAEEIVHDFHSLEDSAPPVEKAPTEKKTAADSPPKPSDRDDRAARTPKEAPVADEIFSRILKDKMPFDDPPPKTSAPAAPPKAAREHRSDPADDAIFRLEDIDFDELDEAVAASPGPEITDEIDLPTAPPAEKPPLQETAPVEPPAAPPKNPFRIPPEETAPPPAETPALPKNPYRIPPEETAMPAMEAPAPSRKTPLLLIAVIVVLVAAGGGGFFYIWQQWQQAEGEKNFQRARADAEEAFREADYRNARQFYEEALAIRPRDGRLQEQLQKTNLQLAEVERIAKEIGQHAAYDRVIDRADSLFAQGEYEPSRDAYQIAIDQNSDDAYVASRLTEIRRLLERRAARAGTATRKPASRYRAVALSSSDDIVKAILSASPNSELVLPEGIFTIDTPLDIRRKVRIRGAGANRTLIVSTVPGDAFTISSGTLVANGVGFEHHPNSTGNVMVVTGGEIDINNCLFRGATPDEKTPGAGILLSGRSRGKVHNSRILENEIGIYAAANSRVTFAGNEIRGNRAGIMVTDQAKPTFENNRIIDNREDGVRIGDRAQPVLRSNKISDNKHNGVVFATTGFSGTYEKNEILNNRMAGVLLNDDSRPTLEGNVIKWNGDGGLLFRDKSRGVLRDNLIIENRAVGIRLFNSAQPTIEKNTIRANRGDGIEVLDKSAPTINDNQIVKNGGDGISVLIVKAGGNIRDNTCTGNQGYGISILKVAKPQMANNKMAGNYEGDFYEEGAID